jgi:hypothetical protein
MVSLVDQIACSGTGRRAAVARCHTLPGHGPSVFGPYRAWSLAVGATFRHLLCPRKKIWDRISPSPLGRGGWGEGMQPIAISASG